MRGTRARRRRRRAAIRSVARLVTLFGAALLASVGWQQWGSAVGTSHAQASLRRSVELHGYAEHAVPGGAVATISIPRIHLSMAVVQGVGRAELARGPGHYPRTALPGHDGNVVIAGHRTTHLAPFWSLDALRRGDEVRLTTREGVFVYRVAWSRIVESDDWSVVAPTRRAALTLTTCWPRFSSSRRLAVRAVLASRALDGHLRPGELGAVLA